jgi:hypothetical protein
LSGAHRPTALHDAAACPQALGPHHGALFRPRAVLPPPKRRLLHARAADLVGASSCRVPDQGVRLRAWRLVSGRTRGSSRFRLGSVLIVPRAVAASGAVRRGGRRSRARRCSRGRRPSGSDSEATGPRAAPLQRHRSGVGGRLTRTRLRHACRLQRPCSLPRYSCSPSIVGGGHLPQRPVADSTARACLTPLAAGRAAGRTGTPAPLAIGNNAGGVRPAGRLSKCSRGAPG